jgi:hypothetical protein
VVLRPAALAVYLPESECRQRVEHSIRARRLVKDEAAGSSPPRPTKRPLTSKNAGRSSFGSWQASIIPSGMRCTGSAADEPLQRSDQDYRRWSARSHDEALGRTAVGEHIPSRYCDSGSLIRRALAGGAWRGMPVLGRAGTTRRSKVSGSCAWAPCQPRARSPSPPTGSPEPIPSTCMSAAAG